MKMNMPENACFPAEKPVDARYRLLNNKKILTGEARIACKVYAQLTHTPLIARGWYMGYMSFAAAQLFQLFYRCLGGWIGRGAYTQGDESLLEIQADLLTLQDAPFKMP